MRPSLEFLLGLIDASDPAFVTKEDLTGPHAPLLALFRRLGLLGSEPFMNPVPSCPHCLAGAPYRVAGRYVCNRCRSTVDAEDLGLWRLDADSLLRHVARGWALDGTVERLDASLTRLGTLNQGGLLTECFFLRGEVTAPALRRILAYRDSLLLHSGTEKPLVGGYRGPVLSLAEVLVTDGAALRVRPPFPLVRPGGAVRFDGASGEIRAGEVSLGRIPPHTREFHLVAYLADYAGELVPYADLKRFVCAKTGSKDETEEATFCQKLKSRLKQAHGITAIDRLIETDRRGGYRMRPELALDAA